MKRVGKLTFSMHDVKPRLVNPTIREHGDSVHARHRYHPGSDIDFTRNDRSKENWRKPNGVRFHLGLRRCVSLLAVMVLTAITCSNLHAHNLGESYLYMEIHQDRIGGRFEISFADLNPALGLSGTDLVVTATNLDEHIEFLKNYYLDHVTISADGHPLDIVFTTHGVLKARGGFVLLLFDLEGYESVPEVLTFDYRVLFEEVPTHRAFLLIEHNWATGTLANESQISLVFSPSSHKKDYSVTSTGVWRGFLAVVGLGVEHILMGFDHVMFLVALLLPAVLVRKDGTWQEGAPFLPALINVVKIVTAFTVAHSVTLSLASLGIVRLPERFVEVAIAASIAIAAGDILWPIFRGRIWLVVFGFGLFHGFGFAGALSDMGVLGEHLGLSLLGFNLGVEIGQVAIVMALFPVLFAVRNLHAYQKWALPVAAVGMILISSVWVVERTFDVDVPMGETVHKVINKVLARVR